jgi:F-type H+-transporting ATPase subunit a
MSSPLQQFALKKIIPIEFYGYDLSFTNSSLFMLLSLIVIVLIFGISARRHNERPTRLQAFTEIIYEMILNLVHNTAGKKAESFIPLIFSLFLFVLACNLLGMLPYGFTATSHIIVTFAMAMVIFIGVTVVGFARHGLHFLHLFLPSGVPKFMAPLIILIELFAYLARPVSLSVRLAANMTAGHIVLKVLASFILMLGVAPGIFKILGILPFGLLTILIGFEIFIAILQAYIFTILTCIYLNDALNLH